MAVLSLQDLPKETTDAVGAVLKTDDCPPTVFNTVKEHLYAQLSEMYLQDFAKRYAGVYMLLGFIEGIVDGIIEEAWLLFVSTYKGRDSLTTRT